MKILFTKGNKMNDRFKFRVWNKNTHSFTTGGAIKFGGLCFVDEEDFGIKLGGHQECYIIEQCTGLKDKNGNLIYEGDLLTDGTDIGTVIWTGTGWGCTDFLFKKKPETLQICGNIHETKGGGIK